MLYKVALTRVTTRVASNTPIPMAPFSTIWSTPIYNRSILDSLISLSTFHQSRMPTIQPPCQCLSIGISAAGRRHARCAQHASKFHQAAVVGPRSDLRTMWYKADTRSQAQNPLIRGTVRWRRSYRPPAGLPLERPDLVPFPSAPSLLNFHLPHTMVWMAENTRPMGADAGVVSLSRMSR